MRRKPHLPTVATAEVARELEADGEPRVRRGNDPDSVTHLETWTAERLPEPRWARVVGRCNVGAVADPFSALTAELGEPLMVVGAEERTRWHQPIVGDRLVVWACADPGPLEESLIRRWRPRYNLPNGGTPCPGCGGRWKVNERPAGRCRLCQVRAANGYPPFGAPEGERP